MVVPNLFNELDFLLNKHGIEWQFAVPSPSKAFVLSLLCSTVGHITDGYRKGAPMVGGTNGTLRLKRCLALSRLCPDSA
jgi:hypothetical protein